MVRRSFVAIAGTYMQVDFKGELWIKWKEQPKHIGKIGQLAIAEVLQYENAITKA